MQPCPGQGGLSDVGPEKEIDGRDQNLAARVATKVGWSPGSSQWSPSSLGCGTRRGVRGSGRAAITTRAQRSAAARVPRHDANESRRVHRTSTRTVPAPDQSPPEEGRRTASRSRRRYVRTALWTGWRRSPRCFVRALVEELAERPLILTVIGAQPPGATGNRGSRAPRAPSRCACLSAAACRLVGAPAPARRRSPPRWALARLWGR